MISKALRHEFDVWALVSDLAVRIYMDTLHFLQNGSSFKYHSTQILKILN